MGKLCEGKPRRFKYDGSQEVGEGTSWSDLYQICLADADTDINRLERCYNLQVRATPPEAITPALKREIPFKVRTQGLVEHQVDARPTHTQSSHFLVALGGGLQARRGEARRGNGDAKGH